MISTTNIDSIFNIGLERFRDLLIDDWKGFVMLFHVKMKIFMAKRYFPILNIYIR